MGFVRNNQRHILQLSFVLGIAICVRLLLWNNLPRTGLISDEGEYLSAATWLAQGRNFSWYQHYLWTRAPLYPLFVAAHFWLFGSSPVPVYISQMLLSLVNVVLVYLLALRVVGGRQTATRFVVPALAALLMAIYLPFAIYPQVLLSETLYLTLLLAGFLVLSLAVQATHQWFPKQVAWFVLGGAIFGLATLTRSLTLTFLPLVALWLLVLAPATGRGSPGGGKARISHLINLGRSKRIREVAVFTLACAVVVLPWTAYNSLRLYGGFVAIDTTGAFNLMLGARTAFDGTRQDAPSRNFALALLNPRLTTEQRATLLDSTFSEDGSLRLAGSCLYDQKDPRLLAALERLDEQKGVTSQAQVQQLMTAEGLCLMSKKPLAFVQKSLGELLDFFQINYSGDERFTDQFALGRLPIGYTLSLFLLDDTLYVLVVPLAVIGWYLARRAASDEQHKAHSDGLAAGHLPFINLIALWWLYTIVVAPLLFAINRFRLPLLPFAFIFAAYALAVLPRTGVGWLRTRGGASAALTALVLFLIAATPFAYLEPRNQGADSAWASYLGPYPSSLASTSYAITRRGDYLRQETMRLALREGEAARAEEFRPKVVRLTRAGNTRVPDATLVDALTLNVAGRAEEALALLPPIEEIAARKDVEASVVLGNLLRTLGRDGDARLAFGRSRPGVETKFVDDANPVQWAWDWLRPTPTQRIDIGDDMDLGYIEGCYLGEGDISIPDQPANYRWCTDGMRIRFPSGGTNAAQTLTIRADGRGWRDTSKTVPPVQVWVNGNSIGTFTPRIDSPDNFSVTLPPTQRGADVVVMLRTATFVPDANDFNEQQGPFSGEARQLGVRLDWVELR